MQTMYAMVLPEAEIQAALQHNPMLWYYWSLCQSDATRQYNCWGVKDRVAMRESTAARIAADISAADLQTLIDLAIRELNARTVRQEECEHMRYTASADTVRKVRKWADLQGLALHTLERAQQQLKAREVA